LLVKERPKEARMYPVGGGGERRREEEEEDEFFNHYKNDLEERV
jgi:hypothetical protein